MENRISGSRLYRSRQYKMIAGVAGGLAQYFHADPTLVRLAMAAAFLIPPIGGTVLLGYIIMAVVVPERPLGEVEPELTASNVDTTRAREIGGIVLVGLGALLLAGTLGVFNMFDWLSWRLVWPLVIVGLGIFLLMRRRD